MTQLNPYGRLHILEFAQHCETAAGKPTMDGIQESYLTLLNAVEATPETVGLAPGEIVTLLGVALSCARAKLGQLSGPDLIREVGANYRQLATQVISLGTAETAVKILSPINHNGGLVQ